MDLFLGLLFLAGLIYAGNAAVSDLRQAYQHATQAKREQAARQHPGREGRQKAAVNLHKAAWWAREAGGLLPHARAGWHAGWLAHRTAQIQRATERSEARTAGLEARADQATRLREHRERSDAARKRIQEEMARLIADGAPAGKGARRKAASRVVTPLRRRDGTRPWNPPSGRAQDPPAGTGPGTGHGTPSPDGPEPPSWGEPQPAPGTPAHLVQDGQPAKDCVLCGNPLTRRDEVWAHEECRDVNRAQNQKERHRSQQPIAKVHDKLRAQHRCVHLVEAAYTASNPGAAVYCGREVPPTPVGGRRQDRCEEHEAMNRGDHEAAAVHRQARTRSLVEDSRHRKNALLIRNPGDRVRNTYSGATGRIVADVPGHDLLVLTPSGQERWDRGETEEDTTAATPAAPASEGERMASDVTYDTVLTSARKFTGAAEQDLAQIDQRIRDLTQLADGMVEAKVDAQTVNQVMEMIDRLHQVRQAVATVQEEASAIAGNLQQRHGNLSEAHKSAPVRAADRGFYEE